MEQVIFAGYRDDLHNTDTEYNMLNSGAAWLSSEVYCKTIVSTSGKIKNLRVKLDGSPGAGKHYDFTLMLKGAPSALTLEIADAATSGADTTHEVDVVAGDSISLECKPTNTPATKKAVWTSMFDGATSKESLILGGGANLAQVDTEYAQLMCVEGPTTTENDHREVCPTSGKIKNLYVLLTDGAPGAGKSYTFTLRKNGASQSLTVTIADAATTGNDTDPAHEVTVVAGDILTMMIDPDGVPIVRTAAWGMTFVADTDGESVILAKTPDDLSIDTTEFNYLHAGCSDSWLNIESWRYQLGQSCTLKKLYLLLSAAPGDGKSYTFTLRKPGNGQADGNLTVTITGAVATTGNDVAHTDVIANDDYVGLECTPADTPDVADAYWGLVGYIEPPAPPVVAAPWNIASRVAMMGA